jgi:hypothetical protein
MTENPQTDTTPAEYEFRERESDVVRRLSSAMRFVGTAAGILAVLILVVGIRQLYLGKAHDAVGPLAQGCLLTLVGLRIRRAARWFDRIVTSQGNDITHLMAALSELGRMFRFQRAAIIVAIGITVLVLIGGAVMAQVNAHGG